MLRAHRLPSVSLAVALLLVGSALAEGRPKEIRFAAPVPWGSGRTDTDYRLDTPVGVRPAASFQDTVFFGGTTWNADSSRWEAVRDSMWTFDSGVGSNFNHSDPSVNPYKDASLHALMEGWVGFDNTYSDISFFRRVSSADPRWEGSPCVGSPAGLGGSYSFWAGVFGDEADSLCYAGGQGYGNGWYVCIEHPFTYNGGTVTLQFKYLNDTEPNYDVSSVRLDRNPAVGNEAELVAYDGPRSGTESLVLGQGVELPQNPGPVVLRFCVATDGAYSDQDGSYTTSCGAFAVDDIQLTGGITHSATFETGDDGWTLEPPKPGLGGDWSDIVSVNDLPPQAGPCGCGLTDSVLVFEDLGVGGHNQWQDNMAASPWIDLKGAGLVGAPGKFLQYRINANLPLLSYIMPLVQVQYYPRVCVSTGKQVVSDWISPPTFFYQNPIECTPFGRPPEVWDFSNGIAPNAETIRVAVGVLSYCRFFSNCSGTSNSTPWFDDIAVGVYGNGSAPLIGASDVDLPQDAFPENGTLNANAPGRIDCNNVKGASSPEIGTSLGDTLVVHGGIGGSEVWVEFAVRPGPGIDASRLASWLGKHAFRGTHRGLAWYAARMDTAEQGQSGAIDGTWMTAYHEEDPNFTGTDTDRDPSDLDPNGQMSRLKNDIFPDDLFTPGTRINLFYRAKYVASLDVPANWDLYPDTIGGNYLEWECLPSSMTYGGDATSEWNCLLYVDHFDGRGAQPYIEHALGDILGYGSANFEHTNWDRYDVRAPSSQQASFGRPLRTEYGASVYQAMGYQAIVWNSGNLNAFNLTKEDGDVLIPWLTLGSVVPGYYGGYLYLSGNGLTTSAIVEWASEPSARELMQSLAGVSLTCPTFRTANCPPGSPQDLTDCPEIDPVLGARTSTRPLGGTHLAQGNGCPFYRSFDVLGTNPGVLYGTPTAEEKYVGDTKSALCASVANESPLSVGGYRTLVDGISVHERRDPGACVESPATYPVAVEERLREAIEWFGVSGTWVCRDVEGTNVEPGPTPTPAPRTLLADPAPNPIVGGRAATLRFSLAHAGGARVELFDLAGRKVRTLYDGLAEEGWNETPWDGADRAGRPLASGVYFLSLSTGGTRQARRLVVVR